MAFIALLCLALAAGIGFVPVWLLRQRKPARAQDYLVASQSTRPEVVRNATIAYALRMTAFVPLFAAGASGDFWPAIVASVSFGLGVYLLYIVRRPLLAFVDRALGNDRSITVHEFITQAHGNDPRVRLLAATLSLVALLGLLIGEALALAILLQPMLPASSTTISVVVCGLLLATFLYAAPAGHSGVMHMAQVQLGLLYFGLFGSATVLLYSQVSSVAPMPPLGMLAIVFTAIYCAILLYYRRSKYVDTERIRRVVPNGEADRESSAARVLSRFAKILNVCISVFVGAIVIVAVMAFVAAGLPTIVGDSLAALQTRTRVPGIGLVALCLLALLHPLVDVTHWQRLAAIRHGAGSNGSEPVKQHAVLRNFLGMYAVESALVWPFTCMLGAIAVIAVGTPPSANAAQTFIAHLMAADNEAAAIVIPLLLICAFAVTLSTTTALFSAGQCTLRYDILAVLGSDSTAGAGAALTEAVAARRTAAAGAGLCLAAVALVWVIEATAGVSLSVDTIVSLLVVMCCAQLPLVPLVLGAIAGRALGGFGNVSPGWALLILASGPAAGVGALTIYVATGDGTWLWAAIPLSLGLSCAEFAVACAASVRKRK